MVNNWFSTNFRINTDFWDFWNCRSIFISYLDGLCMVVYNSSILIKSKKLSLKEKFQDDSYRIKYNFDLFWNRFFAKIMIKDQLDREVCILI